ncbi:MAG: AAA family ATPase [Planctomycetota bacterium]
MAGPHKSLKTSTLIDAAISLATARPWLGRLHVPEAARVLVMSGESGMATIQETAKRIAAAKGFDLAQITGLVWSPDVPRFGNAAHGDALRKMLVDDEIEVVFIDPAYLAMPGADAGNLMVQGAMLRAFAEVCADVGATLAIAHHTKRNTLTPKNEPIELSDIAWAGFAEFARQWWLLNRRERYAEGTGLHKLWLSLGGSAGHSSLWAVDASEGVRGDDGGRHWEVTTENGWALMERERTEERSAKSDERERRAQERRDKDCTAAWTALAEHPDGATVAQIGHEIGINNGRARAALDSLVAGELAELVEVTRGNGQKYPGYRRPEPATEGASDAA